MGRIKKDPIFKKGVWIKEQQGELTIGSLDKNDDTVTIIPDKLSATIFDFENDMMEALYGENKVTFNPVILDVEKLLNNIKKQFKRINLRISFSGTKDNIFKGDYDEIYKVLTKFVLSSISDSSQKEQNFPIVYINASVLQDHLCIIYRDSGSLSHPSKLKKEVQFIKTVLKGEISYKATSGTKTYYDIMIPSKR